MNFSRTEFTYANPDTRIGNFANHTLFMKAIIDNDTDKINLYLRAYPDLNLQDREGNTVLYYAITANNESLVEKLLSLGANVNISDVDDCSPLMHAIESGNLQITKLLLENHANVNHINHTEHRTPLYYAISIHSSAMVKLLFDYDADPNGVRDRYDQLQMEYALDSKNEEIIMQFIEHGAEINVDLVTYAISHGIPTCLEQFLELTTPCPEILIAALNKLKEKINEVDNSISNRTNEFDYLSLKNSLEQGYDEIAYIIQQRGYDVEIHAPSSFFSRSGL